jgi:hypothetical protein
MDLPGSDGAAGICAVIVTHNPALPRLEESLLAVRRQVDQVLIVDNCSVAPVGEWLARLVRNALRGVAVAQPDLFDRSQGVAVRSPHEHDGVVGASVQA